MRTRVWLAAALFPVCGGFGASLASQDGLPTGVALEIHALADALNPGDATLITVRASGPLASLAGEAFGRRVRLWPARGATEWQGLVGVDLETPPGTYDVVVHGVGLDGTSGEARAPLTITGKTFVTRRLRVAERFADPPAQESARIEDEALLLAAVFAESSPERLWRGPFSAPVPGPSTSSFGRLTVINGEPRGRHRGADFRAATGDPVRAPNAGRVVLARDLFFTGNTVVVDHGAGLFSLFAHLSRVFAAEGSNVARNDLLGEAGATGRVTGPHLHWTVRLDDTSIDPASLMTAIATIDEP